MAIRGTFGPLLLAPLLVGCGWVSRGELRTVETKNRVLSEQNRAQQAEIANLREHQHKLEDQLIRADKDVARSSSGTPR